MASTIGASWSHLNKVGVAENFRINIAADAPQAMSAATQICGGGGADFDGGGLIGGGR